MTIKPSDESLKQGRNRSWQAVLTLIPNRSKDFTLKSRRTNDRFEFPIIDYLRSNLRKKNILENLWISKTLVLWCGSDFQLAITFEERFLEPFFLFYSFEISSFLMLNSDWF